MRRPSSLLVLLLLGVTGAAAASPTERSDVVSESDPPAGLACLARSYPRAIASLEERPNGWGALLSDGRFLPWDDGRTKTFEERLADPDLQDVLAQRYPVGEPLVAPPAGHDPGRVRSTPLLEVAYGADRRSVRASLVAIDWPSGERVRASSRNGAADALRRVAERLAELSPEHRHCLEPGGTFVWRRIAGTSRRSAHAYGIAIDLKTRCGEYWRWGGGDWRNRMPASIVEAFEAEGFAWGGRWDHFDTFHFEYRPELFRCRTGG